MVIGTSEGHGFRYEVVAWTDGYLVHMRDLDTGLAEEADAILFRTAAVALRYAEMSAVIDRLAAARIAGEPTDSDEDELQGLQRLYDNLSQRLGDDGLAAPVWTAWQTESPEARRRRYH